MINYKNIRSGNNCFIWTRVSTKHQEENGGSLDDQKSKCEEYAWQKSLNIAGYYGGKHESAQTPGPMIKKMIQAVKKDTSIKYILVTEFDRFSRNAGQAITLIEELRNLGIIVCAVKMGLETINKESMNFARSLLTFATYDNENRTDKFVSGREHCFRNGVWCRKSPLGYTKTGKSLNSKCVLNETGKLIRKALLWKLQNVPNHEILSRLETKGLKITKQTLHHIFTNPFYAGKIKSKFLGNEMVEGVHEAAISYTQFLRIQEIISGKSSKYIHKKECEDSPLKKHVRCAEDDTPFTFYIKRKGGNEYLYYKCNKTGCKTNVSANKMHSQYADLLTRYGLPTCMTSLFERIIKDLMNDEENERKQELTSLKKRLTDTEKSIKDCRIRFGLGEIDRETFDITIQILEERKGNLLLSIEDNQRNLSNSDKEIDEIVSTCSDISTLWRDSDCETKQKIQFLVFPDGILWDSRNSVYRTPTRNTFFDIINRFSASYEKEKEEKPFDFSSFVSGCGGRDSNSHRITPTTPSK